MTTNGFTSEELRTAARVARSAGGVIVPGVAESWEKRAEGMDRLAQHGKEIIDLVNQKAGSKHYFELPPDAHSMYLVSTLLEHGWTPPEGLA